MFNIRVLASKRFRMVSHVNVLISANLVVTLYRDLAQVVVECRMWTRW
jgi:hypothetical protein